MLINNANSIKEMVEGIKTSGANARALEMEKKSEMIAKLTILRAKTERSINNLQRKLELKNAELEEINNGICSMQEHTFTDWNIHNGVIDRTQLEKRKQFRETVR